MLSYDCIKHLFCYSNFIKAHGRGHTVSIFDEITTERYYEKRLREETEGTPYRYIHGKKVNTVFFPSRDSYLEDF